MLLLLLLCRREVLCVCIFVKSKSWGYEANRKDSWGWLSYACFLVYNTYLIFMNLGGKPSFLGVHSFNWMNESNPMEEVLYPNAFFLNAKLWCHLTNDMKSHDILVEKLCCAKLSVSFQLSLSDFFDSVSILHTVAWFLLVRVRVGIGLLCILISCFNLRMRFIL